MSPNPSSAACLHRHWSEFTTLKILSMPLINLGLHHSYTKHTCNNLATSEAGAVAALAEDSKRTKYTCLELSYTFTLIAIETSGIFVPWTDTKFLKNLGNRLRQAAGDKNFYTCLPEVCHSASMQDLGHKNTFSHKTGIFPRVFNISIARDCCKSCARS